MAVEHVFRIQISNYLQIIKKAFSVYMISFISIIKNSINRASFHDFSWQAFEKVFRIVISLVVGVYFTKYLGAELYGSYSLVLSFVAFLVILLPFGTTQIALIEIINSVNPGEYLGKLVGLRLLILTIIVSSLIVLVFFSQIIEINKIYLVLGISSILFRFGDIYDLFFQSKMLNKYTSKTSIITSLFTNSLKLLFIYFHFSLEYFFILLVIEALFVSGLSMYYLKLCDVDLNLKFDMEFNKKILIRSWPYLITSISVFAYMRMDLYMINNLLELKDVGIFSLAVSLSELYYIFPTIVLTTMYSTLVLEFQSDKEKYHRSIKELLNLFLFLGVVVGIGAQLFASPFIIFLFGDTFLETPDVLKIHIWSGIFVSFGLVLSRHLLLIGSQKFDVIRIILGLFCNLLCNLFFIPRYGVNGAAYASLFSQIVANFLIFLMFTEHRKLFKLQISWLKK